MIPPLQPLRLRSIIRWMKDSDPQAAKLPPEALNSRAMEMDEAMIEAFEEQETALDLRIFTPKNKQGTLEREQAFNQGRMEIWQEVVDQFLTQTSSPQLED